MGKRKRTTKENIQNRYTNIEDLYPLVIETKEQNYYSTEEFEYMFNYKLTIKIPGHVISDSRPRGLENTINPNMKKHKYNDNT